MPIGDVSPLLVRATAVFDSKSEFARRIGEPRQKIQDWWKRIGHIPAAYAMVVERETGIPAAEIVEEAYRRRGFGRHGEGG